MDVDALARRAVAAYRRGEGGPWARLAERKLRRSRAGMLAWQALQDDGPDSETRACAALADELARDRRRLLTIAVVALLAAAGVYALWVRPKPQAPQRVPAERGALVLNYGSSGDVDGSPIFAVGYADNVPDLTMATNGFIATGGARIARLPAGVAASSSTCAQAADASASQEIGGLKPGDVVCVRTSAAAVAAVTVSSIAGAGTTEIYQLDIAYWSLS